MIGGYDINNLAGQEPSENEVELTQYVRPNGLKRRMFAPVSKGHAGKAKEAKLILSCEDLGTGKIALYGRRPDQSEEDEKLVLADNRPGPHEPAKMLEGLIDDLVI